MTIKQKCALGFCMLYLFSVIGIALSLHFCGGKLANVVAFSKQTSCKFCEKIKTPPATDGCCKDTHLQFKVKDNHQAVAAVELPPLYSSAILLPYPLVASFAPIYSNDAQLAYSPKPPPEWRNQPIFLINQLFRI